MSFKKEAIMRTLRKLKEFIFRIARFIKKVLKWLERECLIRYFKQSYYGRPISNDNGSFGSSVPATLLPEPISSILGRMSRREIRIVKTRLDINEKDNTFKERCIN